MPRDGRRPRCYVPLADRAGQRLMAQGVKWARPRRVWCWFQQAGYRAGQAADGIPMAVRDRVASRLRRRWRRWLTAEVVLASASGPAATAVAVACLTIVLTAWGVEMAAAYGLDGHDDGRLGRLREILGEGLTQRLTGADRPSRNGWRRAGRTATAWVLAGWGQEMLWADDIMAQVRRQWRGEACDDGRWAEAAEPLDDAADTSAAVAQVCDLENKERPFAAM